MTLLIFALGGPGIEGQRTSSVLPHFDAAKRLTLYTEKRDAWWSPTIPRRTPLNIAIGTGTTERTGSRVGSVENITYGVGNTRTSDLVRAAAESLWFHPALGVADTYARVMAQCAPSKGFKSAFEAR